MNLEDILEDLDLKKILKAVLSVIVAGLAIWVVIYATNPDNNILGIKYMRDSYKYAKEVISEECLLSPVSAKFPAFEPEFVTQRSSTVEYEGIEYDVRTVTSYVDAKNAFGTKVRYKYQVKIGLPKNSDGDTLYYYEIIYCE